MENKTASATEKENYDIKNLYLDFKSFKLDIRQELQDQFEKQLTAVQFQIDKQLSSLRYWGIGAITIFVLGFSYVFNSRLDDTKEYNQARMERLESILFSLASDDFIDKIDKKRQVKKNRKRTRPRHK